MKRIFRSVNIVDIDVEFVARDGTMGVWLPDGGVRRMVFTRAQDARPLRRLDGRMDAWAVLQKL